MVDINLFKDEGEDDKDWTPGPDDESGLGDELNDDFGFDEDEGFEENLDEHLGFGTESESDSDSELEPAAELEEEVSLDDEDLLDDVEDVPDFEEPEEDLLEEEYGVGQDKAKKTSPFIWVFLGIVVVGAAIYQFVIEPRQRAKQAVVTEKPDVNKLIAQMRQEQGVPDTTQAAVVTEEADSVSQQVPVQVATQEQQTEETEAAPVQSGSVETASLVSVYLPQAGTVLDNLSKQGQLGTIILNANQFHIGYVSESPNASSAMEHRIKTLMEVSNVKSSPEERHTTNGRVRYWGVVTGRLQNKSASASAQNKMHSSSDSFIQWVKTVAQGSRLSVKQTEKFARQTAAGKNLTPVRIKVEGNRTQIVQFLASLGKYQGNYTLGKMVIAPVTITDYEARQARIVLDFNLISG